MDKKILKSILSYDFWSQHKTQLLASLFDGEIQELFEIVETSHDKYKQDIPPDALLPLWKDKNPIATRAETSVMEEVINEIAQEEELSPEITADIIDGLWKRDIGKRIGNLGLNIAEGQPDAFDRLKLLLKSVEDGFKPDDFGEPITDDVAELVALTSNDNRFPFNIRALREQLYGIGPGDFIIIFARPETGKTALAISLACAPGGFCEKGAKVLYLGNEEDAKRTKLRAIQAYTGMTKKEIVANPKQANDTYAIIAPRMIMQNIQGWDMAKVRAFVEHHSPDILITDQLDKVTVKGEYNSSHEKLREIYIQGRAVGSLFNCGHIAISQASADAEGKTILTADMMENSKTGKFAEADVVIGIGKYQDSPDGKSDPIRFLMLSKNKITGFHGSVTCKIEPEISRYVD